MWRRYPSLAPSAEQQLADRMRERAEEMKAQANEPGFPGWYRILRCNGPEYHIRYNILCWIERGGHGGPGG
jgi:hypothetical protein